MRSLYRFLQENHGVPNNIARAARVPKLDKRLPTYMDREQTQALFDWAEARAEGDDFAATRDLAILELFYSTGIRLVGAERDEPRGPRPPVGPGQGARQGPEGADRPRRLAGGARPPALS